jgi:polar amino acid transport system permease protein
LSATVTGLPITQARLPPARGRSLHWARLLDVAVIAFVLAGLGWLGLTAERRLAYHWDWPAIFAFLVRRDAAGAIEPNLLLLGLFTTLRLAVWSLVLGLLIGTVFAAMRVARRPALRWLARIYVELVRNAPPIVLIFVFYFFVSSQVMPLLGISAALVAAPAWVQDCVSVLLAPPERVDDFLSGLACLGLLAGAYITEILRAGLQSVPASQTEAARALGLRGWPVFRTIVLPQALRNVLPALGGQLIVSIKDSSLVSLISVQELTFMTSEVSSTTQRFFEAWLFTGGLYFVMCFACAMALRLLERRWAAWGR